MTSSNTYHTQSLETYHYLSGGASVAGGGGYFIPTRVFMQLLKGLIGKSNVGDKICYLFMEVLSRMYCEK